MYGQLRAALFGASFDCDVRGKGLSDEKASEMWQLVANGLMR